MPTTFWRFLPDTVTHGHLGGEHQPVLVLLSTSIAVIAAFTTLAVIDRVAAVGGHRARWLWVVVGAVTMGLGVWAMHFTAMLAFALPVPVSYDPFITGLSLLPVIAGSGVTIRLLGTRRPSPRLYALAGIPLVLGIGTMHFIGMEAMQMGAFIAYRPARFLESLLICYVLAVVALSTRPLMSRLMGTLRRARLATSVPMGLAVTFMHHTAMSAAVFVPMPDASGPADGMGGPLLAGLVALGTVTVVGITFVAVLVDERLSNVSESLHSSETRHRTVLESMSDAVLTVDASQIIESANAATSVIFGVDASTLVGHHIAELVPDWAPAGLVSAASAPVRIACTGRRADGGRFPIEITVTTVFTEPRHLTNVVIRDATEALRHEHALARQIEELERLSASLRERTAELAEERDRAEEATRAKSRFLATMSHEIRTPLNGIVGTTELLLDSPLNEEQREQMQMIFSSGELLQQVINDILDMSKIEAGKLQIEHAGFDAVAMLDAVHVLLAPAAERKNVAVVTRVRCSPPRLVGDALRLRQVLLNLGSNAIKFTDHGTVELELDGTPEGDQYRLRAVVKDTGVGMRPDVQQRLFTPFMQADSSTTRQYGGTGLGLAICKQLMQLMGGHIGVESTVGTGSRFWIELVLPCDRSVPAQVATAAVPPRASAPSRRPRVLVAEDNPVNQRVVGFLLTALGYDFEIVGDGRQAVERWRSGGYDVILMDSQMPEMDGITATRTIRTLESPGTRVPIIAVTANAMSGERERYISSGLDDYVAKPVTRQALADALARTRSLPARA